jgi:hypothetical protein
MAISRISLEAMDWWPVLAARYTVYTPGLSAAFMPFIWNS